MSIAADIQSFVQLIVKEFCRQLTILSQSNAFIGRRNMKLRALTLIIIRIIH